MVGVAVSHFDFWLERQIQKRLKPKTATLEKKPEFAALRPKLQIQALAVLGFVQSGNFRFWQGWQFHILARKATSKKAKINALEKI